MATIYCSAQITPQHVLQKLSQVCSTYSLVTSNVLSKKNVHFSFRCVCKLHDFPELVNENLRDISEVWLTIIHANILFYIYILSLIYYLLHLWHVLLNPLCCLSSNKSWTVVWEMGCLLQVCMVISSNTGRVYRPKNSEHLILYFKDLNLARPDKWGTSMLIAFLQQV